MFKLITIHLSAIFRVFNEFYQQTEFQIANASSNIMVLIGFLNLNKLKEIG